MKGECLIGDCFAMSSAFSGEWRRNKLPVGITFAFDPRFWLSSRFRTWGRRADGTDSIGRSKWVLDGQIAGPNWGWRPWSVPISMVPLSAWIAMQLHEAKTSGVIRQSNYAPLRQRWRPKVANLSDLMDTEMMTRPIPIVVDQRRTEWSLVRSGTDCLQQTNDKWPTVECKCNRESQLAVS